MATRGFPILCLVVLIISTIVFCVGLALPYWYSIDGRVNGGLWHFCEGNQDGILGPGFLDNCYRLQYDDFRVLTIAEREMPVAWIVTQALLCAGLGCVVVSIIAFIIWLMDAMNRIAVLVAVAFYLIAGCLGTAGVIAFGVYWNMLPNGYAFWLVVGGAACWLFMGVICLAVEVCTCAECGRAKIVRVIRRAPFHRTPSDIIPVLRKPVRAQVPVAVPVPRAIEYVEPAPTVVINTPQVEPQSMYVSATCNGQHSGMCESRCECSPGGGMQQHSATVYVDGSCSTIGSGCYQSGSLYKY